MNTSFRTTSYTLLACTLLTLAACSSAPPAVPAAGATATAPTVLRSISLIMGEPNFSMDGGYQELEEGLYSKPELKPGKKMFAPLQDIMTVLGGEYSFDAATGSARYTLPGYSLLMTAGSTTAQLNGQARTADIAPELRNGSLWVPVDWVFTQFGAWTSWDEARQRFTATLALPATRKTAGFAKGGPVQERSMSLQAPEFYASADGRKLADIVVAYQNADGGWPKLDNDVNMLLPINKGHLTGFKAKSTIDNNSTTRQLIVLARAYSAFKDPRYLESFNRGLDYLLAAQHASGGWQQFWPDPVGYKKRITFNDDAIANVLDVLRDIDTGETEYRFVDPARRARVAQAFAKGLDLILKTQLVVGGKKTGWCAQYDDQTLVPAMGRAFELPSISGGESANVARFLMSLDKPSPAVIQAVQDAVAWFDQARLPGQKRVKKEDRTLEMGFDYVLVKDPASPGIWARFYDLENGKPLFTSRDSIPRKDFADVSYERRVKYNWFVDAPRELLEKTYPAWQQRWAPGRSVLK